MVYNNMQKIFAIDFYPGFPGGEIMKAILPHWQKRGVMTSLLQVAESPNSGSICPLFGGTTAAAEAGFIVLHSARHTGIDGARGNIVGRDAYTHVYYRCGGANRLSDAGKRFYRGLVGADGRLFEEKRISQRDRPAHDGG